MAQPQVEELTQSSWAGRGRAIRGRELRVELAATAAFAVAVAALLALAPAGPPLDPVALAVVVAYGVAANAAFPVGPGSAAATMLFLPPLFVLASAALVPVLVFGGLLIATLGRVLAGRAGWDRLATCGGDAIHALGPALVLVVFATDGAAHASAAVIALAFVAQLAFDYGSSLLRELPVHGTAPRLHARVLARVWLVDLALLPFGLIAAAAAEQSAWLALAPLSLVLLLHALAFEGSGRIAAARERLEALDLERRRHEAAIERIGDALASKLDLGALLEVVTAVATETLAGDLGRGMARGSSEVATDPPAAAGDQALEAALVRAERRALTGAQLAEVSEDGVYAIASPLGGPPEPLGVVAVARARPYTNEERALLARLCQQAAVSADEAIRHQRLRVTEARLRHQAFHDGLTGLANRAMFVERLTEAVGAVGHGSRDLAVLFVDLDGFKLANDTLGHEAGDELLVAIGRRLENCLRPGDVAARFGGDEFAAVLSDLEHRDQATTLAERLRRKLAQPIGVRGSEFVVHPSIGLAFSGPDLDPEQLLRNADLAMYSAKQAGGNRVTEFELEMLVRATTRIELAQDLPDALARGDFELRFQPIVDLAGGGVEAVEALVRWHHPSRGVLEPEDFIASAEHMGMIDELGRFVLDEACRLAAGGLPDAAGDPRVSVNVSPLQLRDTRFVGDVIELVRRHGIAAERLMIEVTESMAIEADAETRVNLRELHALGVSLALDDFGTGYSSLSYLAELPLDLLKLDRSLVAEVDRDPDRARLVGGVIQLARSLGLPVVTEGVERASQLSRVRELGADFGQGFGLVEPLDREALMRWLAELGSEADRAPASLTA